MAVTVTWTLCRRLFNWSSFLHYSSYNNTHGRTRTRTKYGTGSRLYGSTTRLSRFRRGEGSAYQSQLRSTVDDSGGSAEGFAREQPLEIWAHRQFDVTNESVVVDERRSDSGSLSRGSNNSLEFDAVGTQARPTMTTVTVKQPAD